MKRETLFWTGFVLIITSLVIAGIGFGQDQTYIWPTNIKGVVFSWNPSTDPPPNSTPQNLLRYRGHMMLPNGTEVIGKWEVMGDTSHLVLRPDLPDTSTWTVSCLDSSNNESGRSNKATVILVPLPPAPDVPYLLDGGFDWQINCVSFRREVHPVMGNSLEFWTKGSMNRVFKNLKAGSYTFMFKYSGQGKVYIGRVGSTMSMYPIPPRQYEVSGDYGWKDFILITNLPSDDDYEVLIEWDANSFLQYTGGIYITKTGEEVEVDVRAPTIPLFFNVKRAQ